MKKLKALKMLVSTSFLFFAFVVADFKEVYAQSSTRCSERYKLAWEMPLRFSDIGTPLTTVLKRSEFGTSRVNSIRRTSVGRAPDGTVALQMDIPKGKNDSSTFFLGSLGSQGVDAACLSLRVFMEPGFQWPSEKGGTKMGWGLWGGDSAHAVSGGQRPGDQTGWSVRNVNGVRGFRLYSYHLNRPGDHGAYGNPMAQWGSSAWRSGRWHTIELEVVMNTLGKNDGYTQLWLDGGLRTTLTNLRFRNTKNWAIRGLMFNDMWGGDTDDPKNWSPKKQKMWYANYKIYTSSGKVASQSLPPSTGQADNSQSNGSSSGSGPFGAVSPSGTIGTGDTVLQWRPNPQATRYYVRVLTKRDKWNDRKDVYGGSVYANRQCSGSTCSLNIGRLAPDQYEWMVRPLRDTKSLAPYSTLTFDVSSSAGRSTGSSPISTGNASSPPSKGSTASSGSFGAVSPSGAIGRSNVTLQWRPDSNANRYYVRVLTKRDKWSDRKDVYGGSVYANRQCSGPTCTLNIGSLPPDQYEWMVRSMRDTTSLAPYSTQVFSVR